MTEGTEQPGVKREPEVRELRGDITAGVAVVSGQLSVKALEEHLAPIFKEMPLDRLHRAAHEKGFRFQGRPASVETDAVQVIAQFHLDRRLREEAELSAEERDKRAWRRNAAIALLSAAVGGAVGSLLTALFR